MINFCYTCIVFNESTVNVSQGSFSVCGGVASSIVFQYTGLQGTYSISFLVI